MSNNFLFLQRVISSVQFKNIIMSSIFRKILDLVSQILSFPSIFYHICHSTVQRPSLDPPWIKKYIQAHQLCNSSLCNLNPTCLSNSSHIHDNVTLRASLGVFPIMRKLVTLHCSHAFCLWPRIAWLLCSWDLFLHISKNQIYPPK